MGARKGGSFERLVCRALSRYISHGERDDLLWRTPSSGGRATIQLKRGVVNRTMAGDALAIAREAAEFCENTYIEAKHYADLQLDRSLICGTGQLARFWQRTIAEAAHYDKRPLLVARQNRFPILALAAISTPIFSSRPILVHNDLGAVVFLFEDEVIKAAAPPPLRLVRPAE